MIHVAAQQGKASTSKYLSWGSERKVNKRNAGSSGLGGDRGGGGGVSLLIQTFRKVIDSGVVNEPGIPNCLEALNGSDSRVNALDLSSRSFEKFGRTRIEPIANPISSPS
jgi:hypothetical protein